MRSSHSPQSSPPESYINGREGKKKPLRACTLKAGTDCCLIRLVHDLLQIQEDSKETDLIVKPMKQKHGTA